MYCHNLSKYLLSLVQSKFKAPGSKILVSARRKMFLHNSGGTNLVVAQLKSQFKIRWENQFNFKITIVYTNGIIKTGN